MKLYFSKGACSLAVRILVHELNLACEFEAVNLKTKKTETGKDYLAINPKGSVPALILNSHELLTENSVIHQFLAESSYATNLLPPVSDMRRYRILEWLNFITTDLHKNCSPIFNEQVPATTKDEVYRPLLKRKLSFVENSLGSASFLMHDQFTLPDGYLFVILLWLRTLKIELAEFPNLSRYFKNLQKRPAIQKALTEEAINLGLG